MIQWFEVEGRHELPWRQTHDPYAILISELMLQQTQVTTVLNRGFFENWLKKFPDLKTLAAADEDSILKAWEGLGYYNRARNLQKAAQQIMADHGGEFPEEFDDILALPGVGRYTAGAVFSFAFGKSAPVVDGNVIRVFSRVFGYVEPVDTAAGLRFMWSAAEECVPHAAAEKYNAGLMEIGQRICSKSAPKCDACPVRSFCVGRKSEMVLEELPVKKNRQKFENRTELVAYFRDGNQVYLTRESGKQRRGLWRLPEISESEAGKLRKIFRIKYGITKFRLELQVFRGMANSKTEMPTGGRWMTIREETDDCAMAAPYRKALGRLIENEFPDDKWILEGD